MATSSSQASSPAPDARARAFPLRRALLAALLLLPIAALLALLAWGQVRTGGRPVGLVNTRLGEIDIAPRPATELRLTSLDSRPISLAALRGTVVLIDFWSSWCIPCRQEAPVLAQVAVEMRERGIEFVGVNIWDTEAEAKRYVERFALTYPNGIDERGLNAIEYGVTGIPEKYIIDGDGILRRKFIGPMDAPTLRRVLEEALTAPAPAAR